MNDIKIVIQRTGDDMWTWTAEWVGSAVINRQLLPSCLSDVLVDIEETLREADPEI